MSFGWSGGDIFAITQLAAKVYTAYKDAPNDYKNIAEEVKSLESIINQAAQHLKTTTLSEHQQTGQEILRGCRSVLEDLNSFIKEYKSVASTSRRLNFKRVKVGTEDIAKLRSRLTSNTILLNSFIQRFDIHTTNIYYIC